MNNRAQAKRATSVAPKKAPASASSTAKASKTTAAATSTSGSSHAVTTQLLPASSLIKAKGKFSNFTASRFTESSRPEQFIAPEDAGKVKAVHGLQRKLIAKNLAARRDAHANSIAALVPSQGTNLGMTLALPSERLKQLCPSYNEKAGTVDLTELLAFLRTRMSGSQFYAAGAPPLVKSAEQSKLQAKAQGLLDAIKKGAPQ